MAFDLKTFLDSIRSQQEDKNMTTMPTNQYAIGTDTPPPNPEENIVDEMSTPTQVPFPAPTPVEDMMNQDMINRTLSETLPAPLKRPENIDEYKSILQDMRNAENKINTPQQEDAFSKIRSMVGERKQQSQPQTQAPNYIGQVRDLMRQQNAERKKQSEELDKSQRLKNTYGFIADALKGFDKAMKAYAGGSLAQIKSDKTYGDSIKNFGEQQFNQVQSRVNKQIADQKAEINSLLQQNELDALDPNSAMSQQVANQFKTLYGEKYGNLFEGKSVKDINRALPYIQAKINSELKAEANKIATDNKKIAELDRRDNSQRQKDEAQFQRAAKQLLVGGRGGQKVTGNQIIKVRSLLDGIDSVAAVMNGEIVGDQAVAQELASIIATALKGSSGAPTEAEIKGLVPQSMYGDQAKIKDYILSKPNQFLTKKQLKQMQHLLTREYGFHLNQLNKGNEALSESMSYIFTRKDKDGRLMNKHLQDAWLRMNGITAEQYGPEALGKKNQYTEDIEKFLQKGKEMDKPQVKQSQAAPYGDEVERNGKTYKWNASVGKYQLKR